MPAIAKTSDRDVIDAARKLIERDGAENLSLQAVAEAVGVRPPSLYKRFADRAALLAAVDRESFIALRQMLERSAKTGDPARDLVEMSRAYRRFAKQHPCLYEVLFSRSAPRDTESDRVRADVSKPLFERLSKLVAEERVLSSARVLTAFVHGFVSMENAGAFRLGPGLDEAFALGVSTLVHSFTS
jgi:AcrR family transcriptional regulator